MNKAIPSSITVEEAVARMVNMDYIPTGFTLLDMTAAFQEEAEVEYENAIIDRLHEDIIATLKIRMDSCKARHELAQLLLDSLQYEVKNPEGSMIFLAADSTSQQRLTLESVSDWAADRYGIGIPEWSTVIPECAHDSNTIDESLKKACWEDITIKIWKGNNIGLLIKNSEKKRAHFRKIGLMGLGKDEPNQIGQILLDLSEGGIFPKKQIEPKDSTAICKLRHALRKFTGLLGEPFKPYNPKDGWKPRFDLIYDVYNAADRIMKRSKPYVDTEDYSDKRNRY
jgi:hypothetical protein